MFATDIAKGMRFRLYKRKKVLVAHGVSSQTAHIRRRTIVSVCIQTVRRHKMCLRQSDFCGFFIHKRSETLNGMTDVFGNSYSSIVVRL